jgi:hypothetical protein
MEDQSKQQTALRHRHVSAEILLRIKAIDGWIPMVSSAESQGIMGTSCRRGRKISVKTRGSTRASDFLRQAVSCMNRLAFDGLGQPWPYWRSLRRSVLRWMPSVAAAWPWS